MKNKITAIKGLVSEAIVNESFLKNLDLYIIKNDNNTYRKRITNRFHSHLKKFIMNTKLSVEKTTIWLSVAETLKKDFKCMDLKPSNLELGKSCFA